MLILSHPSMLKCCFRGNEASGSPPLPLAVGFFGQAPRGQRTQRDHCAKGSGFRAWVGPATAWHRRLTVVRRTTSGLNLGCLPLLMVRMCDTHSERRRARGLAPYSLHKQQPDKDRLAEQADAHINSLHCQVTRGGVFRSSLQKERECSAGGRGGGKGGLPVFQNLAFRGGLWRS